MRAPTWPAPSLMAAATPSWATAPAWAAHHTLRPQIPVSVTCPVGALGLGATATSPWATMPVVTPQRAAKMRSSETLPETPTQPDTTTPTWDGVRQQRRRQRQQQYLNWQYGCHHG